MQKPNARPGDVFIDRYMPHATAAEREVAYQNLERLVAVLVRINDRVEREEQEGDSPESESRGRVGEAV